MQFLNFKDGQFIDFLGFKRLAAIISGILILAGIVSIVAHNGLKYGIDFRGGTNVQIQFSTPPNLDQLRNFFAENGMKNVVLQTFGDLADHEILLGLPLNSPLGTGENLTSELRKILEPQHPKLEIRRIETIGPKVGDELKISAVKAILIALGLVLLYITIRFQWRQGVSAIVALVHDVLVVVGMFSIFDKEFSLTVVAALLTVVGYSLNDTIVVFDRIRENQGKYRKKSFEETINLSITETLSRTLITSGTTLFVVLSLFLLGGEIIHDFAFALLVGVLIGTYSSIYVASPLSVFLTKLVPPSGTVIKSN
ncbi:MAG: protein translocase subunit SecF [Deltaproteobacteria bacterium]|jgi:preprotein translocase subunit SecF|nr:protein translocase subunit SecF [Deltaproteobacteria bacterium]MDG1861388.1 protein translocase subunit SecF [SAR324 cluster bacterium]MBT4015067.1 protein translocase subunit SecF [Deltaproteobacteria bacterium]MBT4184298.1 protein translocase subunit SecF [Deltaproteobacteria bacterium]MBT4629848.1 protein translocase subunit SecF [Deltaproteobacteria bacterium]|tara:strand:+ start:3289 stop:4221 length:933 start_codon:yes stop_codon:yes gene_type:complete